MIWKNASSLMAGTKVSLAEPFGMDDSERCAGRLHIQRLLQMNRQRLAAWEIRPSGGRCLVLGIVGAGVMGTAIADAALACNLKVLLTDADQAILQRAGESLLRRSQNTGMSPIGRLQVTGNLDEIAACDIVLEAVVEDETKKVALLRELDRRMPSENLLATNTSTIPIHRLARGLGHPERLCGTHFFLPVAERPVVEVIFTTDTSVKARAAAIGLTSALGRDALLAPDTVGFLVNRLMMPYVSEAMQLLIEGVAPETIEQAAVAFGMPKGPLSLLDEIGLDTALDCGWVFAGAYQDRVAVSPLLVTMVKAGRLGQKSDAGFFRYTINDQGEIRQETDPAAAELVARWTDRATRPSAEDVAARLFLPMLFEGTRILAEHEGSRAADIDLGAVLGLGMAPARGGPLFWCDRAGAGRIVEIAEPFRSLGARMEPPAELRQMAETGATYHTRETQTETTSA